MRSFTAIHFVVFSANVALVVLSCYLSYKSMKKVNKIWRYVLRRAFVELQVKNCLSTDKPIMVKKEIKDMYGDIKYKMVDMYLSKRMSMNSLELLLEIEDTFGDWIIKNICIPLGLSNGSCLLIAEEVIKDEIKEESACHESGKH